LIDKEVLILVFFDLRILNPSAGFDPAGGWWFNSKQICQTSIWYHESAQKQLSAALLKQ